MSANVAKAPADPGACRLAADAIGDAAGLLSDAVAAANERGNVPLAMMICQIYSLMIVAANGLTAHPIPRSAAALVCVALRFHLNTSCDALTVSVGNGFDDAAHAYRRASGFLKTALQEIGFGELAEANEG